MKKKKAAAAKNAGPEATRRNGIRSMEASPISFIIQRRKQLADLMADDVPRGIDPYDVAIECAPSR